MKMISGVLMSLCLLLSDSVSYASARDLLQSSVQLQSYPVDSTPQSYVPAPAPAAQPSNNALKALLTSLQGTTPSPTLVPTPIFTPAATAVPAMGAAPYCTANIQPGTVWPTGDGTYMSVVNIYLVTHGSQDIQTGWTFSIMNPDYLQLFQTWNWQATGFDSSTGTAAGSAQEFWETIMASAQNQVNIGAIFKGSSPQNFYPRAITVNGQRCYIQQLR